MISVVTIIGAIWLIVEVKNISVDPAYEEWMTMNEYEEP